MAEIMRLRVVTPDGSRLDEEVLAVTARSEVGEFCVLPNHRPILAALKAGRLVVERAGGAKEIYAVDRGFFEGGPDHVNVITAGFGSRDELDAEVVERELGSLRERLASLGDGAPGREELELDLEWAQARKALVSDEW